MSFLDLIYPKKCFNHHLSLFSYRGLIREMVKQLKFKFLKDIEGELQLLIESGLRRKLKTPNIDLFLEFLKLKPAIQPLPLFWYRQNWRGFNQAELIAKIISNYLKLNLSNNLVRLKSSQPQSRLPREKRLTNIKGVFSLKPGRLPSAILLVDDVWTTGATMTEAGEVFKKAGVKSIWGLSLAR